MKKILFILFIMLLFNVVYGSTVSIVSSTIKNNYEKVNRHWSFKVDIVVNITDIEDSFVAMGLYLNFDTNYLLVDNLVYNEDIVLDIENDVKGNFIDSNGQNVRFQVRDFDFDNSSGHVNSIFFAMRPNLIPVHTNGHFKIFSIYFNPIMPVDTTVINFNFTEPRLTTLSREGNDQTDTYIPFFLEIDSSPKTPVIFHPLNNTDTNAQNITINGYFEDTNNTIILYKNGLEYDSNLFNDTDFTFNHTFSEQGLYKFYAREKNQLNNLSQKSNEINIIFDTAPPEIISTYPENNTILNYPTVEKIRIEFSDNLSGIDTNTISISLDTGAGEIIYTNNFIITDNEAVYNNTLTPGDYKLNFTVSDNASNHREESIEWKILELENPSKITLLFPEDNTDTEFYRTINFEWNYDIQAETYQFQIDTQANFTTLIHDTFTNDTFIKISNLDFKNYYWRVRAKNRFYTGDWSNINNIKTGVDLTSPVISSVNITNTYGHNIIDNTDEGITINANFDDNHLLYNIGFFYGLNDTNILTDNYTISNPPTGTHSHTFSFREILTVGDIIYIRLTATDKNNNQTDYFDTITVRELTVEKPLFVVSDTYTNRSQFALYGTKQVRANVRINEELTATSLSDTEWERTITLTEIGKNRITARAFIGNVRSEINTLDVIFDNIPPSVSDNIAGTYDSEPVSVRLSAFDEHSGVKNIYYSLDGGNNYIKGEIFSDTENHYYTEFTVDTEGTYFIRYFAVDKANNTSAVSVSAQPVRYDITPPAPVTVYDEGNISIDTSLEFYWDLPLDSSPIINYFIEVSNSLSFTSDNIIYSNWLNYTSPRAFKISGDTIVVGDTYYARIKSMDAAGHISDFGDPSSGIHIDTSVDLGDPPPKPILFATPTKTNVSFITLSGTYPASARAVLINGSPADEMNPSSLTWSKFVLLQLGENPINVYCRNDTGLISESETTVISFNNVPPPTPTFTVQTPTNIRNQTIIGNKSSKADTVLLNETVVDIISDTEWTYEIELDYGNNLINVKGIDSYNNVSDITSRQIFFNDIPPDTPYVTKYTSPYADYTQIIEGWFDTAAEIVRVQGSSASINRQLGKWVFTVDLDNEGANLITIETEDIAGNKSDTELTIIRNTTPPDVPVITRPIDGHQTAFSPEIIRGTKPENSWVYVNGRKADSQTFEDTVWTTNVPLSTGYNLISATSRDELGNESDDFNIIVFFNINLFLVYSDQIDGRNFILKPDNIELTLNRQPDLDSLNNETILLYENDVLVEKNIVYDSSTRNIRLDYDFKENNFYTIVAKQSLQSEDFTELPQDREWRFRILINNSTNSDISLLNDNVNLFLPKKMTNVPQYYVNIQDLPRSDGRIINANNTVSNVISTFWRNLDVSANYYELNLYNQQGTLVDKFNDTFTIKLSYPDSNNDGIIDNTDLQVENTFMFKLDKDLNVWHRLNSVIDTKTNTIKADVSNLGVFTLLSSNKKRIIQQKTNVFYLDNGNLIITVPDKVLPENIYFDYSIMPLGSSEIRLANSNLERQGFYQSTGIHTNIYNINCYHFDGTHIVDFDSSVKVEIKYEDTDGNGVIDGSDIAVNILKPFRLNPDSSEWEEVGAYTINYDNNTVEFNVNKFSIFSLLSSNVVAGEVWIYPNPTVNKKVNLLCRPQINENVRINIVTPFGKNVYSNSFTFNKFNPQPVELDLRNLAVGAYFAIIEIDNKKEVIGIGIGR